MRSIIGCEALNRFLNEWLHARDALEDRELACLIDVAHPTLGISGERIEPSRKRNFNDYPEWDLTWHFLSNTSKPPGD
jgi:hypothetical protein